MATRHAAASKWDAIKSLCRRRKTQPPALSAAAAAEQQAARTQHLVFDVCMEIYIQQCLQVSARGSFQHSQQVVVSRMGAKAIWAKIQFIIYLSRQSNWQTCIEALIKPHALLCRNQNTPHIVFSSVQNQPSALCI
jgi:hypothetical protein